LGESRSGWGSGGAATLSRKTVVTPASTSVWALSRVRGLGGQPSKRSARAAGAMGTWYAEGCHIWAKVVSGEGLAAQRCFIGNLPQNSPDFTGCVNLGDVSRLEEQVPRAGFRADYAYVYLFCCRGCRERWQVLPAESAWEDCLHRFLGLGALV